MILAGIFLAAALLFGGKVLSFMAWSLVLYFLVPLGHSLFGLLRIKAGTSSQPLVLYAGDQLVLDCEVTNPSNFSWPRVEFNAGKILKEATELDLAHSFILEAHMVKTWQTVIPHLRRGKFKMEESLLSVIDIYGVFRVSRVIKSPINITVYPRVLQLDYFLVDGNRQAGDLLVHDLFAKNQYEVDEIRPYRVGDPVRFMHWKSSARTGQWQQRKFGRSSDAEIFLTINSNAKAWKMDVSGKMADLAVDIAVSLVHFFLNHKVHTSLMLQELNSLRTGNGVAGEVFFDFMDLLAGFKPQADDEGLNRLVNELSEARTRSPCLFLITPEIDEELGVLLLRLYLAGWKVRCLIPEVVKNLKQKESVIASLRSQHIAVHRLAMCGDLHEIT
ncbi:MAG: hypothetical protein A2087_07645 [Spirochaetes bacterium GWD1_61_31]|nr:MAG: hypothetical protein A2Y37_07825 [Spirochaetes bacterium GWB1_60_80]OHD34278.1 MAG: hypothetical protein A2004_12925 [Spirochaetes bacterium GWC1_61_12]OHD40206.1 MAG: hypothetical protein A2087_07645 [Spirochaetes bacterium GWD1_61_31]OHD45746.1 MAG: hypothetical protein A2Y35_03460 [Spirochaetes bacterium GWE1_60_18]OHD58291.1 MAG: hypothetical protein A2Y32_05850 [Spirochaetes bacterium GWF1_60_12]